MSEEINKKTDLKILTDELIEKNNDKITGDQEERLKEIANDNERFEETLKIILDSSSLSILKNLSLLESEIDYNVAENVFGDDFEENIRKLVKAGLLEKKDGVIYFKSMTIKQALTEDDEQYHLSAYEYYLKKAEMSPELDESYSQKAIEIRNFEALLCALKHSLATDNLNNILETFKKVCALAKRKEEEIFEAGEKLIENSEGLEKVEVLKIFGNYCYDCGMLNKSIKYLSSAANLLTDTSEKEAEKHLPDLAKILNNLGNAFHASGDFKEAEKHFKWAATIFKDIKSDVDLITTLENLAVLYTDEKMYENAEKLYNEIIRLRESAKQIMDPATYTYDLSKTYHRLANVFWLQNKLENAEETYKTLIKVIENTKEEEDKPYIADAKSNLAAFYVDTGRMDDALKLAQEIMSDLNVPPEIRTKLLMTVAKAHELKGEKDKASDLYMKSAALSFILFRQHGLFVTNFLYLLEKVEELSTGEKQGDSILMRKAILKNYYGQRKLKIEEIECGKKGQVILQALQGKNISNFEVESHEDMAAYLIANDIR